jgi:transposase
MARRRIRVAEIKEILVHWDAGRPISRIAATLGYSRPTVRKYVLAAERAGLVRGSRGRDEVAWERLARATLAQVQPGRSPGPALAAVAPYHPYLAERVGQVRLSVLYQRLRSEHELAVSWATFYRYARAHWPERLRPPPRVTVPLPDPPPGEEAQVDFFGVGRWEDPQTGRRHKLSAFLLTLSHSRHQFLYPVLGEDATTWLDAHVAAFTFLGGAPRRLVPDNLAAGILKADRYDPRVNRAYGELVRAYGCLVDPARVQRPTDKPRVERNVDYARHSFFTGRTFTSLASMRTQAAEWCRTVAGQRVHGTTHERPYEAFLAREQAALLPLPPQPWELVTWLTAKVQTDCRLQAGGAPYSVPHPYVGRRLDVRLSRTTVEIYDGPDLVTTHVRQDDRGALRLEHYPAPAQAFLRATPAVCRERALAVGPATGEVVTTLLEPYALHHLREVQALLRLVERYGSERLERACRRALDAGDGRYRTVRGLLERDLDAGVLEPTAPETMAPEPASAPPFGAVVRQQVGAFLRGPAAFAAVARALWAVR